jgi:galactose mutarotase-like enzyme
VVLRSAALAAEIDPLGAQLSALRDRDGRDLLWEGNPSVWAGRAPLLFPIVGVLAGGAYRWRNATYRLPRHGFARGSLFRVDASTTDTAVMTLAANEDTLRVYPFNFELTVHFELAAARLSVTTTIRNRGSEEMPASFGYHPGLRWPLPFGRPRAAHFIEFEREEFAPIRRIDAAGLLTAERHATPVTHRRLLLKDELFQDDVMIFEHIESRSVLYGCDTGPRVRVSFPDAPYLGIWTKPGAGFICIEPWHGVTDTAGFTGDFGDKAGVFILPGGGSLATTMAIALVKQDP